MAWSRSTYNDLRDFIESELQKAGGEGWISYVSLRNRAMAQFPMAEFDSDLRQALHELNADRTGGSGKEQYRLRR